MRTMLATPGAFRRLLVGPGLFGAGLFLTTLLILLGRIWWVIEGAHPL